MGMRTTGNPWVPWDSHANASNSDYIMGMAMGVGIKVWELEYRCGNENELPLQLFNVSYENLFSNT